MVLANRLNFMKKAKHKTPMRKGSPTNDNYPKPANVLPADPNMAMGAARKSIGGMMAMKGMKNMAKPNKKTVGDMMKSYKGKC